MSLRRYTSPLDTLTKRTVADSIDAVKYIAAVAEAIKAFDDFKKEDVAAAKHDADSTANDVTKAEDALKNYNGVKTAEDAYAKIYRSFWGYADTYPMKDGDYKAYPFTWTKKTFLEPTNCVEFTYNLDNDGKYYNPVIIDNSALQLILGEVDPVGYYYVEHTEDWGTWSERLHRIFNNNNKLTEFAEAILAAQIVEDLGNYTSNKARLEKINAQVTQIREDVEAAIAEYEAAKEGLKDVEARFYGVDEDGNLLPAVGVLTDASIVEGKWALGGYQLAWAEELAPEYPEIVKNAVDAIQPLQTRKANLTSFKRTLDQVYTAWWNEFEKDGKRDQRNVAAIVKHFETKIDDLNDQIDVINVEIAGLEELIDACEAGYSPAEAKVAPLKKKVEAYKKYLEQAEEALARAQKEYDEVIAAYGVKE